MIIVNGKPVFAKKVKQGRPKAIRLRRPRALTLPQLEKDLQYYQAKAAALIQVANAMKELFEHIGIGPAGPKSWQIVPIFNAREASLWTPAAVQCLALVPHERVL